MCYRKIVKSTYQHLHRAIGYKKAMAHRPLGIESNEDASLWVTL